MIEGITERFVDALEGVASGHENLQFDELQNECWSQSQVTLSKAVEQERGWVATKMGLFDMFVDDEAKMIWKRPTVLGLTIEQNVYNDTYGQRIEQSAEFA